MILFLPVLFTCLVELFNQIGLFIGRDGMKKFRKIGKLVMALAVASTLSVSFAQEKADTQENNGAQFHVILPIKQ